MKVFKQLHRVLTINRIFFKYGLDEFTQNTTAHSFRWFFKTLALYPKCNKEHSRGQRLSDALTELGPIFIKFGQMLSTRRDLLPPDIAEALMQLQDNVSPFDSQQAIDRIESELGQPIQSLFQIFEQTPMASASIAQVHAAQLLSGEDVVIKVIRPGIRKRIAQDLSLMHRLARWIEHSMQDGHRFKAEQVVRDYEVAIYNELDLRTEAANTMQLRRNFENSPLLYVPKVEWELTREKVMVLERIYGIPIADIQSLDEANVDRKELAHRGVEIFFTQVFHDSFFHADMHPGNIFVNATDPLKPQYIGIDCGIMGTLAESDKRYLAENFLAFFKQDYRRIAELHVQSGWVNPETSIEAFEAAIRTACEPIFGKPLSEISFGQFLIQLFQVARRFEMEVQPQLVLLQKTLLYVEGLGRQLYPELDLWETAQPFLKQWISERLSPKTIFKRIKQRLPIWIEQFPEMPEKIAQHLEHTETQNKLLKNLTKEITQNRIDNKKLQKINTLLLSLIIITLIVTIFR